MLRCRRESGECRICYSLAIKADFSITGPGTAAIGAVMTGGMNLCCGFGNDGMGMAANTDCIIIQGQSKKTAMSAKLAAVQICGGGMATRLTLTANAGPGSVCSELLCSYQSCQMPDVLDQHRF